MCKVAHVTYVVTRPIALRNGNAAGRPFPMGLDYLGPSGPFYIGGKIDPQRAVYSRTLATSQGGPGRRRRPLTSI
jgi:hypothetical protein